MIDKVAWKGTRVLVTGHTGFKGAWLSLWLSMLEASVAGYALAPPTEPSLFATLALAERLDDVRGDVRENGHLRDAFATFRPEVVFHLAAQPLVREGYRDPAATYATNVMGTVHVLEACRAVSSVRAVVVVTSDKCYENRGWPWGYRESDALGGFDPYSSSKACVELVCDAYRRSFFSEQREVALATARAGNVIGGGDWAADRLIPDLVRAFVRGGEATIRHPEATRPWQHVLEPLDGYLVLAQNMIADARAFSEPWNFGPDAGGDTSVRQVVEAFVARWPSKGRWRVEAAPGAHEAQRLMLDSAKARARLGWRPRLALDDALRLTVDWYAAHARDPRSARETSESQIRYYSALA